VKRLLRDYLTYVGMVLFCMAVWLARKPLEILDRGTGRPVREKLIDWIGRIARA
jgi:hypothetical protein